jgi:WD40 repeat protein
MAFSPDGTLLATAADDNTARIWDLATGATRTTLQSHTLYVNSMAFSPDGTLLATAGDGAARICYPDVGIADLIPVTRLSRCARDHACAQLVNWPSIAG